MGIVTISAYMCWFVVAKDSMDGWNAGVMFSETEGGHRPRSHFISCVS
jgi:hypothetical protein